MSPTALTLRRLRADGALADVCERWVPKVMVRRDLFGLFDVIALDDFSGVLGIQATTEAHAADRVRKMRASPVLARWLARGNRAEVWGWRKVGRVWTVRVRRLCFGGGEA